mmetsp:Transcript_4836/g.4022  ORF Transcript_4836/g.4022 Transcript_4836/m.4022 type:complete len:413 (-) Transcript_4836:2465-3703(-)
MKREEVSGKYVWKDNQVKIEDIKGQFPVDIQQVPDIFINVYTRTFFGSSRVGYVRIKSTDKRLTENKPKWFPVKNAQNNLDDTKIGLLLINAHLFSGKAKSSRIPKKRNINADFHFLAYIYGAYDLCPNEPPEKLKPEVKLKFSSEELSTKPKVGKHPIWNVHLHKKVNLCENLEFASNLIVTVESDGKVKGDLTIPALSCGVDGIAYKSEEEYFKNADPELYVIKYDGLPTGRILAHFALFRDRKVKDWRDTVTRIIEKKDKEFRTSLSKECDIEFAIVGARNLPSALLNASLQVTMPRVFPIEKKKQSKNKNKDEEVKVDDQTDPDIYIKEIRRLTDEEEDSGMYKNTKNPNFCQKIEFLGVRVPQNPLYLPIMTVTLKDSSFFGGTYYIDIPLYEYCDFAKKERVAIVH